MIPGHILECPAKKVISLMYKIKKVWEHQMSRVQKPYESKQLTAKLKPHRGRL